MPRGRPRKNPNDVLIRSAELIGWALGGIEREILETRSTAGRADRAGHPASARSRARRPPARAAAAAAGSPPRRSAAAPAAPQAPPPQDVARGAQAHLRDDEEALGRAAQEVRLQSNACYKHKPSSQAALGGAFERQARGRHVLDRHPQRLEDRDLGGVPPAGRSRPPNTSPSSPGDVRRVDRPFADRDHEVARFGQRAGARVDEHPRVARPAPCPSRADRAGRRRRRRCARRRGTDARASTGSRDAVTSAMTSAPSAAASRRRRGDQPRRARAAAQLVAAARARARRPGPRRGSPRTAGRASARRCGCAPARRIPSTASTRASGRARCFADAAETAAVRASVM